MKQLAVFVQPRQGHAPLALPVVLHRGGVVVSQGCQGVRGAEDVRADGLCVVGGGEVAVGEVAEVARPLGGLSAQLVDGGLEDVLLDALQLLRELSVEVLEAPPLQVLPLLVGQWLVRGERLEGPGSAI